MNWTLWQIFIAIRAVYGVNRTAHSYEAPHSKKLWGYLYVDTIVEYPKANTYEADPMADSHSYQSSVWSWSEPSGTQLRSIPTAKSYGVILMSSTPYQTPMNSTLWQIATAIRAVYGVGVNLTAHSYKAPHSKKLWVYPNVEYPIANIYQADPMAHNHSYRSSVWSWSEPYGTQLRSTPQRKATRLSICRVPHSKHQ